MIRAVSASLCLDGWDPAATHTIYPWGPQDRRRKSVGAIGSFGDVFGQGFWGAQGEPSRGQRRGGCGAIPWEDMVEHPRQSCSERAALVELGPWDLWRASSWRFTAPAPATAKVPVFRCVHRDAYQRSAIE